MGMKRTANDEMKAVGEGGRVGRLEKDLILDAVADFFVGEHNGVEYDDFGRDGHITP